MSQEIAEVRSIIRQILLEGDDMSDPAYWNLKKTAESDGVTYTFVRMILATIRNQPSSVEYSRKGTSGVLPNVTFTLATVPDFLRTARAAAGSAKPAAPSTTATRPAAAGSSTPSPKPKSVTGYRKLNSVLKALSETMGTQIPSDTIIKLGEIAYPANKIPNIKDSDELSVSTVAYLYVVSGELKTKINGITDSGLQKFLSIAGLDKATQKLDAIYNDAKWMAMRNALLDIDPTGVAPALRVYMDSLSSSVNFDRNTVDGFADYLVKLASAVGVNVAGAEGASSSAPGAGGTSPSTGTGRAEAPTQPQDSLTDFLSYDAIVELTQIQKGELKGDGIGSALAALKGALRGRISSVNVYDSLKSDIRSKISTSLDSLPSTGASKDASITGWTPPQDDRLTFSRNEQGLIQFLKAAYIITRGTDDKTGTKAAEAVRLSPDGKIFPTNDLWIKLSYVGAFGATPIFALSAPESVPVGGNLVASIGGKALPGIPRGIATNPGDPVLYSAGTVANEGTSYESVQALANFLEDTGLAICDAIRKSIAVTLTLTFDGRTYRVSRQIRIGDYIKLSESDRIIGQSEQAQRLSGQSTTIERGVTTKLGATEGGIDPLGAFNLQNVYAADNGQIRMHQPSVILSKKVNPLAKDDVFTLAAENPEVDYILIPIPLSTAADAVTQNRGHWTSIYLSDNKPAQGSAVGGARVGYLPVSRFSWGYDENVYRFGSQGSAEMPQDLVEFTPSSVDPEKIRNLGITVLTEDEARALGTGSGDPIKSAIIQYVQKTNNPTGTALYLSATLNTRMNGYARRQRPVQ